LCAVPEGLALPAYQKNNNVRVVVHGPNSPEKLHNLFLGTINSERLENDVVQNFEVDFGDGRISTRGEHVNEFSERFLSDNNLVNLKAMSRRIIVIKNRGLPRPPLPCSVIKSRSGYIPLTGQD